MSAADNGHLEALAMLAACQLPVAPPEAEDLADALISHAITASDAMGARLRLAVVTLAAALYRDPLAPIPAGEPLALAAYDVAAYSLTWHAPALRAARCALAAAVERERLAAYTVDREPDAHVARLAAAARHADDPETLARVFGIKAGAGA